MLKKLVLFSIMILLSNTSYQSDEPPKEDIVTIQTTMSEQNLSNSMYIAQIEILEENFNEYEKKMEELNDENVDYEQWFKEYKEMIEPYDDKPLTLYDVFDEKELDLLFRVVQSEIGSGTFTQKANVASVIFNRLESDRFTQNTLTGILTASGQFASPSKKEINDQVKSACEFAFEIMDTTDGCVSFRSDIGPEKWGKCVLSFNDGEHYLYKFRE